MGGSRKFGQEVQLNSDKVFFQLMREELEDPNTTEMRAIIGQLAGREWLNIKCWLVQYY